MRTCIYINCVLGILRILYLLCSTRLALVTYSSVGITLFGYAQAQSIAVRTVSLRSL